MAFSNRFVMSVIVDGDILKENKDGTAAIPFGSDYTLRFRNKHPRRAVVKIFIDGENVSGSGYIIPSSKSHDNKIDIKRHSDRDRTFRFVSLDSSEAIEHGKNDNSDRSKGVIEARFYLEKEIPKRVRPIREREYVPYPVPLPWYPERPYYWAHYNSSPAYMDTTPKSSIINVSDLSSPHSTLSSTEKHCCTSTSFSASPPSYVDGAVVGGAIPSTLSDGCTVEGTTSGQTFTSKYIDTEDNYTSVTIVLKGYEGGPRRKTSSDEFPKAVDDSSRRGSNFCTNCGRKARDVDKFCGNCGNRF